MSLRRRLATILLLSLSIAFVYGKLNDDFGRNERTLDASWIDIGGVPGFAVESPFDGFLEVLPRDSLGQYSKAIEDLRTKRPIRAHPPGRHHQVDILRLAELNGGRWMLFVLARGGEIWEVLVEKRLEEPDRIPALLTRLERGEPYTKIDRAMLQVYFRNPRARADLRARLDAMAKAGTLESFLLPDSGS